MKGWDTFSKISLSFIMFSTLLSLLILDLLKVFIAYNLPVSFFLTKSKEYGFTNLTLKYFRKTAFAYNFN